jgi:allophanate hydrolase
MSLAELSFDFATLRAAFARGDVTPHAVVDEVFARLERDRDRVKHVWLHVLPPSQVHGALDRAARRKAAGESLPLFGLPFAVKDNIDVAGAPTTMACPAYSRVPERSAVIVDRLVAAGALVVGKVNLDQFASGLVGVRSPYGTPTNPFDPAIIPGGSSSGSAVSVAAGQVAFALGTDTAGSGRVPAAMNNVVGFKPSRGALSTSGLVPACRSIDCASVFALTVSDACEVADAARGWDEADPFSRSDMAALPFAPSLERGPPRVGIPSPEGLVFLGDTRARAAFEAAVARVRRLASVVEVDFAPFREAGEMLYGGPWVVERLVAAGDLLEHQPEALLPVLREILGDARRFGALDVYTAMYRLRALGQRIERLWDRIDALLVPTAPTVYRIDEVLAQPRALNTNLGLYTTFTNLLDLAAMAVPGGMRSDGLPSGISFVGPRGSDRILAAIARLAHHDLGGTMGATPHPLPALAPPPAASPPPAPGPVARRPRHEIVVVGAHLAGQPLNQQLTALGGVLVRAASTAPRYRLFALRGTTPPKPGLVRVREGGHAIAVEVWSLDEAAFGAFVAAVPRPLCIGSIDLDDGGAAPGFLCEPEAVEGAVDISQHRGWRAYLSATSGERIAP